MSVDGGFVSLSYWWTRASMPKCIMANIKTIHCKSVATQQMIISFRLEIVTNNNHDLSW